MWVTQSGLTAPNCSSISTKLWVCVDWSFGRLSIGTDGQRWRHTLFFSKFKLLQHAYIQTERQIHTHTHFSRSTVNSPRQHGCDSARNTFIPAPLVCTPQWRCSDDGTPHCFMWRKRSLNHLPSSLLPHLNCVSFDPKGIGKEVPLHHRCHIDAHLGQAIRSLLTLI